MKYTERIKVRRIADGMLGSVKGFGLTVKDNEDESKELYYFKIDEAGEESLVGPADKEYVIEDKTNVEVALEESLDQLNIIGEQLVMSLNNVIEVTEENMEATYKTLGIFTNRIEVNAEKIKERMNRIRGYIV